MPRKRKTPKRSGKKRETPARKKGDKPFHNPFVRAADQLKEVVKKKPKPMPKPKPPPKPGRAEPDLAAFQREMANVQPLDGDTERIPAAGRPVPPRPIHDDDAEVLARLADLVSGEGPFDVADTTEYVEGIARGLDKKLLYRLKRGDYSLQSHLDLHGMNRDEAHLAVAEFLKRSRLESRRCVLLVSGRGQHSKDKEPVLKNHLVRWLTRGSLSKGILAFCTARPHDGGGGALYVLLRK